MSRFATDFTISLPALAIVATPTKDTMTERLSKIDFVIHVAARLSCDHGVSPHLALPVAVDMVACALQTIDMVYGDPSASWCKDAAAGLVLATGAEAINALVRARGGAHEIEANQSAFEVAVEAVESWPEIDPAGFISMPGAFAADLAAYAQAVADGCCVCADVDGLDDDDDDELSPPRVYVVAPDGRLLTVSAIQVDDVDGEWLDLDGSGVRVPSEHAPGTLFVVYGGIN